jgi:hypothetical protein
LKVGPFPSEEAFYSQVDGDIEMDSRSMISFLAQELAVNHPELSVTFELVEFFDNAVKGAIQSLNLDPATEEEALQRRDQLLEAIMENDSIALVATPKILHGVQAENVSKHHEVTCLDKGRLD